MMSRKKISHCIGHGLAHLQNTVDAVVSWGFQKLQESGEKKSGKNIGSIIRGSKKTAKFLGEMGIEYFKKYEELKQTKKKKSK